MTKGSTADFLLEIGTEEMPAQYVSLAIQRYQQIFTNFFETNGLMFEAMQTFATPRRLAFWFKALSARQSDRVDEVRGPAAKAGKNAAGEWSPAAQGFARSQGINVTELMIKDTPAGPYLFAVKSVKGQPTKELLSVHLPALLTFADWPKSMRWGAVDLKFIRPIRWLLALLGDEVVPICVADVTSSNITFGHRTLAPQAVQVGHPSEYAATLANVFVMANVEERRAVIARQVQQLAETSGYIAQIDEKLLDEVTQLVEYPTAFMGSFDEGFLVIPDRVIVTSMKENQRYFPVYNKNGELAPRFIGVRNGGERNLEQVVKGNEKVLTARLADATFFFAEDQKVALENWQTKLRTMTYQDELGSVYDRELRIAKIASEIANALHVSPAVKAQIETAARFCKFDLATHMVYEFPELEGYMGGVYANLILHDQAVGQAIEEQYFPKGSGAPIAKSLPGKVVALADKLERLVGGVSTLGTPTGSQDPYGLRRSAIGIVRTLAEGEVALSLEVLVDLTVSVMGHDETVASSMDASLRHDVLSFLSTRFKTWLVDSGLSADVAEGLVSVRPYAVLEVANISGGVAAQLAQGGFRTLVETSKRVRNILAKQVISQEPLQIDMFKEEVERNLFETVLSVQKRAKDALLEQDAITALQSLLNLEEPVNRFFEQVMVMDERDDVRAHRLSLLNSVQNTLSMILDLSQIVTMQ